MTGLVLGAASFLNLLLMSRTWLFQTPLAVFTFTIGLVLCITALVLNSIADLLNRGMRDEGR